MASQSAATPLNQVNEDSKYYVVDPDDYPISTLSITYRVEQTEPGPLIDFGSTAKIMVANASQPLALYDVASNLGNHDPRYTESEWLSPDLCQRIARRFLLRKELEQVLTNDIQFPYSDCADSRSIGRPLLNLKKTVISVSGWPNIRHPQALMALRAIFMRRKHFTGKRPRYRQSGKMDGRPA